MRAVLSSLAIVSTMASERTSLRSQVQTTVKGKSCKAWCKGTFAKKGTEIPCTWNACAACAECKPPPPVTDPVAEETVCEDKAGFKGKNGKNCDHYKNNWCANGKVKPGRADAAAAMGIQNSSPETSCCACGGGTHSDPNADHTMDEQPGDTCATANPCQNHGRCTEDPIDGPECDCVGGFSGNHCDIEPTPGEIIVTDPTTSTAEATAKVALAALNAARAKNQMKNLDFKKIVSYQVQEVAGVLHTFCLETQVEGKSEYVKIVWDDFAFGEGPHMASVSPLYKSIKFLTQPTSTFVCTDLLLPIDRRSAADRAAPNAFIEERDIAAKSFKKINKNAALLEEKNDLPAQWDARVDHAGSAKCADLINHIGNQGTCGSCYAWAALGTASINACLAGHTIGVNGFSIQDVLSCGGIWEGDFQNNVLKADIKQGVNGQTFAGGCEGHFAGNVFEYATKYGLVDEKCQHYAHNGDPLTHFDANAGADECKLTNNGPTAVKPGIDVRVKPSQKYVEFLDGLTDAVFKFDAGQSGWCKDWSANPCRKNPPISTAYRNELLTNTYVSTALPVAILRYDKYKSMVENWVSGIKRSGKRSKLKIMSLDTEIPPGGTVDVDMVWCKNRHPTNEHNMQNVVAEAGGEPSCLAKFNDDHTVDEKFTVSCSTDAANKVALSGPKGETVGGIDNSICECPLARRVYEKNGQIYKPAEAKVPSFTQLGKHTNGECHRTQSKGGTFNFKEAHASGCGKVHNVFHTPVMTRGASLSEEKMMRAIMKGGAIAVSFSTTASFMAFDGQGVWEPTPTESMDGGHAILFFGWGVDASTGTKFWWAKNSWGPAPAAIFKFVRGKDAAGIESRGASWVSADSPGTPHSTSIKLTSHPKGFCPDELLDPSVLDDKSKITNSCVSMDCGAPGEGCELKFGEGCRKSKKTCVDLISDKPYRPLCLSFPHTFKLNMGSACIANIRVEDQ